MTLPTIRRLQKGQLGSLVSLLVLGLGVALLSFAIEREDTSEPRPAFLGSTPVAPNGATLLAAGNSLTCIPTGAHATGAGGTNWRTDVEVHNPGATQAAYSITLLKRDNDNGSLPADATKSFTLDPGLGARYTDIIDAVFHFSGAAALRITATSGTILVTSRTYNQLGSGNPYNLPVGSTFGQFVPAFADTDAITSTEEGRLIQLSHTNYDVNNKRDYRANIGVVNAATGTINLAIDLHNAATAVKLGTVPVTLRSLEYRQFDAVFANYLANQPLANGYAVIRCTTPGGRFFAFASVIDNRTGDPIFIPAQRTTPGTTPPTPTPTPTRTSTPSPTPTTPPASGVNLAPYKPSGWENPVVPDYQTSTSSTGFLSTYSDTYVDWAVANFGPGDIPGRINFELRLDGNRLAGWYSDGLQAGHYTYVQDYRVLAGTISAGVHTLTIVADYDNQIPETNEGDNSWGKSWEWTSIVFVPPAGAAGANAAGVPGNRNDDALEAASAAVPQRSVEPVVVLARVTAGGKVCIPTGAHATGAGGTNWRTDVEVHNPGATQAAYSITLLKRDNDNGSLPADATKSFTLDPGLGARYTDIIDAVFHFSGAAALRITATSGTILVTSRTYNQLGSGNPYNLPVGSTFGQFVPAFADTDAITSTEEGRLIQLSHTNYDVNNKRDYRANIGVVNAATGTINLAIDLHNAATAVKLGTVPVTLRSLEYKQFDAVFANYLANQPLANGYAVIRCTTPGGRFFAFASVIDNRTGDPIFIPAQRTTPGTTPPTPTPTPTQLPTQPMGVLPTVNDIFTILSSAGLGNSPTIDEAVHNVQTYGIDTLINNAVQKWPTLVTKVTNGARVNFGSGTTLDDGTVLSGVITGTVSGATINSTQVRGTVNLVLSGFAKNGSPSGIQNATSQVNLTTDAAGHASGTVSLSGSGTSSLGTTTLSGSVQVNTAACPRYPVGGTVTVVQGGQTTTVTFNSRCDGSYDFTGPALTYYGFEFWPLKCDGSASAGYRIRIGAGADTGRLIVSPACTGDNGPANHRLGGTVSPTHARFFFQSWYNDHFYAGTFDGTSTNGGLTYSGTVSYTVTAYNAPHDPGSGVRCQSPVYTASGSNVLFVRTSVPCL